MNLALVFAIVYLTVDISYVLISKGTYSQVVAKIQGSDFPELNMSRIIAAFVAYAALVLGWYIFATKLALDLSYKMNAFLAGAVAGAIYGIVVYGVFNGTLHVMFHNYDVAIATRDMLWGTLWASLLTGVYSYVANRTTK